VHFVRFCCNLCSGNTVARVTWIMTPKKNNGLWLDDCGQKVWKLVKCAEEWEFRMWQRRVSEWVEKFKRGRKNFVDNARYGRSSTDVWRWRIVSIGLSEGTQETPLMKQHLNWSPATEISCARTGNILFWWNQGTCWPLVQVHWKQGDYVVI